MKDGYHNAKDKLHDMKQILSQNGGNRHNMEMHTNKKEFDDLAKINPGGAQNISESWRKNWNQPRG